MTTSTTPISLAGTSSPVSVAQELGLGLTTQITMNDAGVRTLAGVGGSGTVITMNDLRNKSNRISIALTISADVQDYVVNTAKASGYVSGLTDFTLTINSGIYVGSTSTGSYGMDIDTSWAAGDTVTIINNGYIVGRGGNGGNGTGTGVAGSSGGPALRAQRATSITNASGVIGGGGGGGGGSRYECCPLCNPGVYFYSAGGGGMGYNGGSGGTCGGSPVFDGAAGTKTSGGIGGQDDSGGGGAAGGTAGVAGSASLSGGGGGGGGLGAAGASAISGGAGAAGAAVSGNSNITWNSTGTRYGGIS